MLILNCFETISTFVFLKKRGLCNCIFQSVSLNRNVLAPHLDVTQITRREFQKTVYFCISWEYTGAQGQVREKCFCFTVGFIGLVSWRTMFRQSSRSSLSPCVSPVPSEYFCLLQSQRWLTSSFLVKKGELVLERDPEWFSHYKPAVVFFPRLTTAWDAFCLPGGLKNLGEKFRLWQEWREKLLIEAKDMRFLGYWSSISSAVFLP